MTHRITPLLLAFGGALLVVGLALSITAKPTVASPYIIGGGTQACTDCHTTPHTPWQVAPHDVVLTDTSASATPACSDCHDLQSTTFTNEHTAAAPPEVRLLALRGELARAYAQHPDWQTTTPERTQEQVLAAQAEALLTLIEADTSWGFHSSEYIQKQLDEAEALLHMLTAFSR